MDKAPVPRPDDLSTLTFSENAELFAEVAQEWLAEIQTLSFYNTHGEDKETLTDIEGAIKEFISELEKLIEYGKDKVLEDGTQLLRRVAADVRNKLAVPSGYFGYFNEMFDVTPSPKDHAIIAKINLEVGQIVASSKAEVPILE